MIKSIKKHILPFLVVLCMFFGCIPEDVLTNVEPAQSKLVISSQIVPGDIMLVIVSRSFSALEGNEDTLSQDFLNKILVSDARVTISWDDKVEILEPLGDVAGLYTSTIELDENASELRLDVFDPLTNDSVYAITSILPRVDLDSARFTEEINSREDTTQLIYYSFADAQDKGNWYVLNAFGPNDFINDFVDNPFEVINGNAGVFFERLVSDQTFDSTHFEQEVRFFVDEIQSDSVVLFFSNISEGYFRFLDARQRTGGIISSASSEPINFPTNVIGGLGYFNAHNPSIILVEKER